MSTHADEEDGRANAAGPTRREYLVHAALFAGLVALTSIHFDTSPETTFWVRMGLGLAIAWFLFGLVRGRPPAGPTWRGRLLRGGCWLVVTLALLQIALASTATLLLVLPMGLVTALGIGLLLSWVAGLWLRRRRRVSPAAARLFVTVSGSLYLLAGPATVFVAWSPPSPETCRAVAADHGEVAWLTGPGFLDEGSQPFQLEWIPERELLVGSMKMARNAIPRNPRANQLVLFDTSEGSGADPIVVERHGQLMPEYMTANEDGTRLAVTYIGYGRHRLEVLDITDPRDVEMVASRRLPSALNSVIALPGGEALAVFEFHQPVVRVLGWKDLQTIATHRFGPPLHAPAAISYAVAAPRAGAAYVYMANGPVIELGLPPDDGPEEWRGSPPERLATVPFGAGVIAADGQTGLVARGDMLGGRVQILGTDPFELRTDLSLSYRPRPVLLDPERELLLVGDWYGGAVHARSYGDWNEVAPALPTGFYLRDVALDGEEGHLYAASMCGIYRLDLDDHLDAHGAAR